MSMTQAAAGYFDRVADAWDSLRAGYCGALPERKYLVRQAGFVDVAGQRGLSGGQAAGVAVYSLSVTARKP